MADHELIERHLQALARRLPGHVVEELAGGLVASYEDRLERLGNPDAAARAALADFGDTDMITAAFVRVCPGRGTALRLLVAGPMVGLTWGVAFVAGQAWTWPVPLPSRLTFGVLLGLAVLMLVIAVRERHHYRTVRLAALAGAASVVILDSVMLTTVVVLLPQPSVLFVLALTASVSRIMLVVRDVPAMIRHR